MRQITKILAAAFLLSVAFTGSLKAQDITPTLIQPSPSLNNDTAYWETIYGVGTQLLNEGGSSFNSGDQITVKYVVSDSITNTLNLDVNQQIDSGIRINLSPATVLYRITSPTFEIGENDMCIIAESGADTNKSNDTFCQTFNVKKEVWDIGVSEIMSPDPSKDLDTNGGVEFQYVVKNYGNKDVPNGVGILNSRRLVGDSTADDWSGSLIGLADGLPMGDTSIVTTTLDADDIPDTGNHDVCFETFNWLSGIDTIKKNDKACNNYNFVDEGGSGFANNHQVEGLEVYPNPFTNKTKIKYRLNTNSMVSLKIYNVNGQAIKTVVDGQQKAGQHRITINRGDLNPGTYIYRLKTEKGVSNGRLLVK